MITAIEQAERDLKNGERFKPQAAIEKFEKKYGLVDLSDDDQFIALTDWLINAKCDLHEDDQNRRDSILLAKANGQLEPINDHEHEHVENAA
jgi:hypothetical protein